jgi:hypothetical protein
LQACLHVALSKRLSGPCQERVNLQLPEQQQQQQQQQQRQQ